MALFDATLLSSLSPLELFGKGKNRNVLDVNVRIVRDFEGTQIILGLLLAEMSLFLLLTPFAYGSRSVDMQ